MSSLLCSFAYGDLERRKFRFSEDNESVGTVHRVQFQLISVGLGASEAGRRLPAHHDELFEGEDFSGDDDQRLVLPWCNLPVAGLLLRLLYRKP